MKLPLHKIDGRTLFRWLSSFVLFSSVCWLGGCASPPPFDDLAIARSAITAAQEVDSAKFAKGFWSKAEENFLEGQKAFQNRDFEIAKKLLRLSTQYAERAENLTRLKKFQTGDSFP